MFYSSFGFNYTSPIILIFSSLILSLLLTTTAAQRSACILLAVSVISALFFGYMHINALLWILLLFSAAYFLSRSQSFFSRSTITLVIFVLSIGFLLHKVPGFNNPVLFDGVFIGQSDVAFTKYLNLDKGILGVALLLLLVPKNSVITTKASLPIIGVFLCATIACLAFAMLTQLIAFEPKLPAISLGWLVTNLWLTCYVEEAFFRGFIQNQCQKISTKHFWQYCNVLISGGLFGLAHFPAGPTYTVIATVIGSVYAYSYLKSRNILVPISLHFAFNCIHFFFFSYPYLSTSEH